MPLCTIRWDGLTSRKSLATSIDWFYRRRFSIARRRRALQASAYSLCARLMWILSPSAAQLRRVGRAAERSGGRGWGGLSAHRALGSTPHPTPRSLRSRGATPERASLVSTPPLRGRRDKKYRCRTLARHDTSQIRTSNSAAFTYDFAISRRIAPKLCLKISSPFLEEGAGNAGCPMHPQPRARWVVKYAHEYSQRRHRIHPAFPTQWFYGLYVLSPGTGFLAPVIGAMPSHRRPLGISVGMPGPHDFAVRTGSARLTRRRGHRIPLPTFMTIAKRPSCGGGIRGHNHIFLKNRSEIFLSRGLDERSQLESLEEIALKNICAALDFRRVRRAARGRNSPSGKSRCQRRTASASRMQNRSRRQSSGTVTVISRLLNDIR